LRAERLRGELAQGLDQSEKPPGRPRLPHRKLSTRRVVRKRAFVRQRMRAYELRSLAFCAEAEIFKLHHRYDRIIVISLDKIDIARLERGHRPEFTDIELPAAAQLYWIARKSIVSLDRRQDANSRQIEGTGDVFATHDERLRARAWHHAVEKMDWIGNWPRRHILIER